MCPKGTWAQGTGDRFPHTRDARMTRAYWLIHIPFLTTKSIMIDDLTIRKIKEAASIVDVIADFGVYHLKLRGKYRESCHILTFYLGVYHLKLRGKYRMLTVYKA